MPSGNNKIVRRQTRGQQYLEEMSQNVGNIFRDFRNKLLESSRENTPTIDEGNLGGITVTGSKSVKEPYKWVSPAGAGNMSLTASEAAKGLDAVYTPVLSWIAPNPFRIVDKAQQGNIAGAAVEAAVDGTFLKGIKGLKSIMGLRAISNPAIAGALDSFVHPILGGVIGYKLPKVFGKKLSKVFGKKFNEDTTAKIISTLGGGLGYGASIINYVSDKPVIHTNHKKLNDILNYPFSTISSTINNDYPWTNKINAQIQKRRNQDILDALNFQKQLGLNDSINIDLNYNSLLDNLPSLGKVQGFYKDGTVHVYPYKNIYSNIDKFKYEPLNLIVPDMISFRGTINHELTHGVQEKLKTFTSQYDWDQNYYRTKDKLRNVPQLQPFIKKEPGWTASPDEFDAELSNLQISTGKSPFDKVDNILPLQLRFWLTNKEARDAEDYFINRRRNIKNE